MAALSEIPMEKNYLETGVENDFFPSVSHDCCPNCSANDWIVDVSRGDLVCRSCGVCTDSLRVNILGVEERSARMAAGLNLGFEGGVLAEIQNCAIPKRFSSHPTYQHVTYFNERLSQVREKVEVLVSYNTWCQHIGQESNLNNTLVLCY